METIEKIAKYSMSVMGWCELLRDLEEHYTISESGDKHFTINYRHCEIGKSGDVYFPKKEGDSVKLEVTDSTLEKHIDSFRSFALDWVGSL